MSDDSHKLSLDDVTDARDELADALGMHCEVEAFSPVACEIVCRGGGYEVVASMEREGFEAVPRWKLSVVDDPFVEGVESPDLDLAIAELCGEIRKAAEHHMALAEQLKMIAEGESESEEVGQ